MTSMCQEDNPWVLLSPRLLIPSNNELACWRRIMQMEARLASPRALMMQLHEGIVERALTNSVSRDLGKT